MRKKAFSELTKDEEQKAISIHRESIIIDGLACPQATRENVDKMINGGITAANWTIGEVYHNLRQTIRDINAWYSVLKKNKDKTMLVTNIGDIMEAKKQKKHGVIFGVQNADPIEDDIDNLEVLHRLGLRVMQLTYMIRNRIGDGVGEKKDAGLSYFGEKVVKELNRLGILIDLSHCGRRTAIETIEISKDPVSFTHVGVRSLTNHIRNKTDEELKAVAEEGGVIGATCLGLFIYTKEGKQPIIDDYFDQIDYMVDLIGVDHVGIGLDIDEGHNTNEQAFRIHKPWMNARTPGLFPSWFTWQMFFARDLISYSQALNITKGLVGRGYSDQEIKKILGENFLRLYEKVWK